MADHLPNGDARFYFIAALLAAICAIGARIMVAWW